MQQGGRIMLVDDDTSLLRLLSLRLEAAGFEVFAAQSAEQGLSVLISFLPNLVITDLRMEGMDGMALFNEIRRAHPLLPVIILTAHGSIPDAVNATKNGVFGFLTKPFDSKTLMEQVHKALSLSGTTQIQAAPLEDKAWRSGIVSRSLAMEDVLSRARLVAESDASVLIQGESGTGKELLARAIHEASPRRKRPFVAINCGAIPEALLESELFGHRKGAFTGALQHHEGLFASAHMGTIFLDEIGDMPLALQVKLLRVLQERQVRPVGATHPLLVDVRVISATHRNLEEEMAAARFREDLYYRLNVVNLKLPPLSARREDIPLLADHFRQILAERYNREVTGFAPDAMEALVGAAWSGNVRELYNVVEQAVALSTSSIISQALVQQAIRGSHNQEILPFADARKRFEREYLASLLHITQGNVAQAARLAQRNRTEFYKLLSRHKLNPSLFKDSRVS